MGKQRLEIGTIVVFKVSVTLRFVPASYKLGYALMEVVTFSSWGRLASVNVFMQTKSYTKIASSQPSDKSLEAYKIWIRELSSRFTTNQLEIKLTQQEWIASWKQYWNAKMHK